MIIDNTPKQEVAQVAKFGSTPPVSANIGDLFFKTTNRTMMVFTGSEWISLASEKHLAEFKNQVDEIFTEVNRLEKGLVTAAAVAGLEAHSQDSVKHLTDEMYNLLNNVNGISFLDLNKLVGTNTYLSLEGDSSIPSTLKKLSDNKLSRGGGTMIGSIDMSSNTVTGLRSPLAASDAVNKQYVDTTVVGIKWMPSVYVATTKPIQLKGVDKIDGEVPRNGKLVLVKNQTDQLENGIYICSYDNWVRVPEFPTLESLNGYAVSVNLGQTQKNTTWLFTENRVIDLAISQTAASQLSVSDGLIISENNLSLNLGGQLTINNGQLDLAKVNSISAGTTLSVGSSTQIPVVSFDQYGRVISAKMVKPTGLQPANITLSKLAIAPAGLIVKTSTNSIAKRSIDVSGNGISVIDGDAIAGNPIIKLSAVSTNTIETLVYRDLNGDFSANIITATLQGTASHSVSSDVARSVEWKGVLNKPTALSQFKNDAQFVTQEQLFKIVAELTEKIDKLKLAS